MATRRQIQIADLIASTKRTQFEQEHRSPDIVVSNHGEQGDDIAPAGACQWYQKEENMLKDYWQGAYYPHRKIKEKKSVLDYYYKEAMKRAKEIFDEIYNWNKGYSEKALTFRGGRSPSTPGSDEKQITDTDDATAHEACDV